ncbi:MAG TPA: hypothetical protein GXX28_11330 [Firmicutes bacterium]|nr:hypothetical protein [Bacillota bacterium]
MWHPAFWGAVATGADFLASGRPERSWARLLGGAAAVGGGLLLGLELRAWLPEPGAVLLGAGVLGYLGLYHLAEAGGVILPAYREQDGALPRSGVTALALTLSGSDGPGALLALAAGGAAGLALKQAAFARRWSWRALRLLAAAVFCGLSLVTFRGAT